MKISAYKISYLLLNFIIINFIALLIALALFFFLVAFSASIVSRIVYLFSLFLFGLLSYLIDDVLFETKCSDITKIVNLFVPAALITVYLYINYKSLDYMNDYTFIKYEFLKCLISLLWFSLIIRILLIIIKKYKENRLSRQQ